MRFKMLVALFSTASTAISAQKITHKVFFDITQGENSLGRVVFGLYGDNVPKVNPTPPF
jgi:peptidyl-prolyl cis-trans isomerase B (cyclophilin B)